MSTADVIILVTQADQVTQSAWSGDDKNNSPFNLPLQGFQITHQEEKETLVYFKS